MYIEDTYQEFIHLSRYARWREDDNRRESWQETVDRYVDYMVHHLNENNSYAISDNMKEAIRSGILNREILPSMRALMSAGPALERENVAGFNCSFLAINDPRAFDEALYILMNGTGVGFSVEREEVDQLPSVPPFFVKGNNIVVADSKMGWAQALQDLISSLYRGEVPSWDLSLVRPAGARLRTFGGRASGPEPLNELLNFTVDKFNGARGRKLSPIECHEIMCKIGEVVVVGGVRRSALISLSNLEDLEIREAKWGEFWNDRPHLSLANNSVAYTKKPDRFDFDAEFSALIQSGSGERGVFSRYGARRQADEIGRDGNKILGTNPCGEITLRDCQFCNLTTVVVDPSDSLEDLVSKVAMATYLGTFQSALTNFNYLRDRWKKNTEEERLLGVSLSGIFGHPVLSGQLGHDELAEWLFHMRSAARVANILMASEIGIEPSAAITCIKPEGTTSQLTGTSSGMHPWHNKFYKRNIRGDVKDPLSQFMVASGIPYEVDIVNPSNYVFTFPIAAPEGAITRDDMTAIEHLELWSVYSEHWADHNPSVTINVRSHEWEDVREWVWDNFDNVVGISFLPTDDNVYQQAPYEDCDEETYNQLKAAVPEIDWANLQLFESHDQTKGSQEMACMAGSCDIVIV